MIQKQILPIPLHLANGLKLCSHEVQMRLFLIEL